MNPKFAIRSGLPIENELLGCWLRPKRRNTRILAHLAKMSLHRFTRGLRITAFHGIKDSLVMELSAPRTAIDIEDSLALFSKHSDD
jgi:hypothetical protein